MDSYFASLRVCGGALISDFSVQPLCSLCLCGYRECAIQQPQRHREHRGCTEKVGILCCKARGRWKLGIRGKLLLLAAGIAVLLVIVGALDLRNMWRLSRSQLDDSVKQQVDLASVALQRWL